MICRCIEDLIMVDFKFKKDNYYEYRIEKHKETERIIYYIKYPESYRCDGEIPMVEEKFKKFFDDIQYVREQKLKQILND